MPAPPHALPPRTQHPHTDAPPRCAVAPARAGRKPKKSTKCMACTHSGFWDSGVSAMDTGRSPVPLAGRSAPKASVLNRRMYLPIRGDAMECWVQGARLWYTDVVCVCGCSSRFLGAPGAYSELVILMLALAFIRAIGTGCVRCIAGERRQERRADIGMATAGTARATHRCCHTAGAAAAAAPAWAGRAPVLTGACVACLLRCRHRHAKCS